MLFLLRKIRRKLISNNKLITYLLYAIGEIILVVVGILIAVSIDDWNTDRNNQIRQQKQLQLIRNEMANNLNLLEIEWQKLNVRLEKQIQFIDLMNSNPASDTISEKALSQLLFDAFNFHVNTPVESAALVELISSGGLKDIKNDSIRKALSSWDARLIPLRKQEERIERTDQSFVEYWRNFEGFSMRQYHFQLYPNRGMSAPANPKSNKAILSSQTFENTAITLYGQSRRVSVDYYPQYKNDLIAMISMLDKELTK